MNCATNFATDWVVIRKTNLARSFIWVNSTAWTCANISDRSWLYWEHFMRKWYSFSTCFALSLRFDTVLSHFGWRQYRWSRWIMGRVYLSVSTRIGRQPSLSCANLFLKINGILLKRLRVILVTSIAPMDWVKIWKSRCHGYIADHHQYKSSCRS